MRFPPWKRTTQQKFSPFDPSEIAYAFSGKNPSDFVRPEANPTDEASAEDDPES